MRNQNLLAKTFPPLAILFCLGLTGCNLCCPPYMDDYATVGGKWARANPTEGRVGSAFSDPGIIASNGGLIIDAPAQEYIEPEVLEFQETEIVDPLSMNSSSEVLLLGQDFSEQAGDY